MQESSYIYIYIVVKIWRDFNVLSYIACPRYPYIRVYQLYDRVYRLDDRVYRLDDRVYRLCVCMVT